MKSIERKFKIRALCAVAISFLHVCAAAGDEASAVEVKGINDRVFGECYRLRNEKVEVVVAPRKGRIVFYGYIAGKNQLWTNPRAIEYKDKMGGWNNWGGDKVWIWPQAEWSKTIGRTWPPPDAADAIPWKADVVSDRAKGRQSLILESAPIPSYGVRIIRCISLAKGKSTELTVETRFLPIITETRHAKHHFAVWTVTQVPLGEEIFARLTPGKEKPVVYPMKGNKPWPEFSTLLDGRIMLLKRKGKDWFKGGLNANLLAVRKGQVLLIQRALTEQGQPKAKYLPGERAQICSAPDNSPCYPAELPPYLELEFTSPVQPLSETHPQTLTVKWSLHRLDVKHEQEESEASVRIIENLYEKPIIRSHKGKRSHLEPSVDFSERFVD